MNCPTGTVPGKAGPASVMDWSVNSSYKSFRDLEPKNVTPMDMALIQNIDPIDVGLNSSEKGNSVSTTKPRKKTMTSVYLKYFETASDGKTRRCKFCGQSYSIATATGNLGRHLNNRHPGYDKATDLTSAAPQAVTVARRPPTQPKTSHVELDYLNWLLIKWLVSASLPPSTLEEKWLGNSFKFLNPAVQIWPADRIQAVLQEVFRSMQEDVVRLVEQVSSKVSITLDFWTSYEQILYMSVTCQWIDENWSFQKVILDICRMPCPCGGAEIYHALMKVFKLYSIESRILSCTHDNSPGAVHACHTVKQDMDSLKVSPFCYLPCAARTLDSIINDCLGTTKTIISKIREFVQEMNASIEMSEDFVQFAAAYQEGNWKFPLDSSTRWSGNYQMLDVARKASRSMETVIRKNDEVLGSRMLLNSAEKIAVNIMHSYLEPFYKTIENICRTKVLTIGLVLFFMDHISEMISACKDSRQSPEWLKSSAEDMATKAHSYHDQVCNVFTYMTTILDPRIKVELIPESLNLENYLEEARSHFIRNYSTSPFSSVTSSYASQEIEDAGNVSFAEEIARKKRRANMASATDELSQYLTEPPAPIPTDVLEWWKVNSARYPRLSVMARDFLAVQATAVAPEDLFCSKGDDIDRQRFSTRHNTAQALCCINSWMKGGLTLKYKHTEIDFDRMMEMAAASATETSQTASEKKQKS